MKYPDRLVGRKKLAVYAGCSDSFPGQAWLSGCSTRNNFEAIVAVIVLDWKINTDNYVKL